MSYKKLITEILSEHADQILKQQQQDEAYSEQYQDTEQLPPLLSLAEHVNEALLPVEPTTAFRDQLHRDLMAAAHLKLAEHPQESKRLASPPIIAAVMTLIATVGLVFIWRRQNRPDIIPS